MQFASTEELDVAIDWLWADPQRRELPRVHVGRNTIIIPADSVDLFRDEGYRFTLSRVVSAGELSSQEINRLRACGLTGSPGLLAGPEGRPTLWRRSNQMTWKR